MRLASVHVLVYIEHNNVIECLHFERDSPRVCVTRFSDDKFDLDMAGRPTRARIERKLMCGISASNEMAALVGAIDAKDADKHVDGSECVGVGVRKGGLILTVSAPLRMLLVGIKDVDDEFGDRGYKTGDEHERQNDGNGMNGSKGGSKELDEKRAKHAHGMRPYRRRPATTAAVLGCR